MEEVESLRAALVAGRPRSASLGYPPALRERVARYAAARRAAGVLPRVIAAELGVSRQSVVGWGRRCAPAARSAALVPVEVTSPAPVACSPSRRVEAVPAPLTLVTPRGFRVEGLSLDTLADLLGRIG